MSKGTRHFIRHFVEMVVAMGVGMLALDGISAAVLPAVGTSISELEDQVPALTMLAMAVAMTAPMVWWMRYRGHGWRPCVEMSAAMFVPTLMAMQLMALGLVTDYMTLMVIEHNLMLPAMLVAMLLRRDEYTGHHGTAEVAA